MKQKLKFVLLLVLTLIIFTGCGNKTENINNNVNEESNDSEEVVLSLGEKGVMKNPLGEFEVTVDSFEVHDSYDGKEPEYDDRIFLIVNFTVKNIGDTVLEGYEVSKPTLLTEKGNKTTNYWAIESIDRIKEELQPGEEDSGQMFFQSYDSEVFDLTFGYGRESISTVVTWKLNVNDAK